MNLLDRLLDLERQPQARPYSESGYNLDGFRRWVDDELGAPHRAVPWIHIAGTKGKGSTAAITESLLRAAGLRTGLYTSPHLTHYRERFRLDGAALSLEEFDAELAALEPFVLRRHAGDHHPVDYRTVFEVLTAMAFRLFAARGVEVGVLEVGLGGRLDCTNIVDPAVAVITSIGLDHMKILGDTLEAIAGEKAGILKPGRPAVWFADTSDEAVARPHRVIAARACELGIAPTPPVAVEVLARAPDHQRVAFAWRGRRLEARLHLLGDHQARNLGLALAAVDLFARQRGLEIDGDAIARGVEAAAWTGRLDILDATRPALVLDGAHCPLSARALGQSLDHVGLRAPGPWVLLWGMQADKDHAAFVRGLVASAPAGSIPIAVCYRVPGSRGADAGVLAQAARAVPLEACEASSPEVALSGALALARAHAGSVLAAGTLYTLASLREQWEHAMKQR